MAHNGGRPLAEQTGQSVAATRPPPSHYSTLHHRQHSNLPTCLFSCLLFLAENRSYQYPPFYYQQSTVYFPTKPIHLMVICHSN